MPASPTTRAKVTMRNVANAAGVSLMTVSLALRGDHRITTPTRKLVNATARKLGYRRDPLIGQFMTDLKRGNSPRYRETIALSSDHDPAEMTSYTADMLEGVMQRAELLGYRTNFFNLNTFDSKTEPLGRILRARGIRGIILLPLLRPIKVSRFLDWSDFSVITTSYTIIEPHFHRVVPEHFGNIRTAILQLSNFGYRRFGFVLAGLGFNQRVFHSCSAVMALQNEANPADKVAPLYWETPESQPEFAAWMEKHRPDVILTNTFRCILEFAKNLKLRIPQDVGLVDIAVANNPDIKIRLAGCDQRSRIIGEVAVDQLSGLIQRGERGVPKIPIVTHIEGQFRTGQSIRRQHPKGRRGETRPVLPLA